MYFCSNFIVMIVITPEQKLADVILRDYNLIPVVNSFGIELGFGDKTIASICSKHQIDAVFFSVLLNVISSESYVLDKQINVLNTSQLLDYLRKTLANYKVSQINVIDIHIAQLIASSSGENEHLQLIENFFFQFKTEFNQYESDVNIQLYDVIESVYDGFFCKGMKPTCKFPDFELFREHFYQLNEKLSDMKSLLIKYLSGNFDRRIRNAIIYIISRFEEDMHNYMRLQYKLFKPMMQEVFNQIQTEHE